MATTTTDEVRRLALGFYRSPGSGDSTLDLRDYLDIKTGGDLDCIELDILEDRVKAHVRKLTNNLVIRDDE